MKILNLIMSVASSFNGLNGKAITFTTIADLVSFLTILDDSKMSFTFGSLLYSKIEDGISAKYDHDGNIIEKKSKDIESHEKMAGNVLKVAYAPIQTITSYTQKILNKLSKKGIVMKVEDLKVQKTYWAKRHKNSMLAHKVSDETKTPFYLAYFPNGKAYNKKFYNRITKKLIGSEDLKEFYNPSKLKKYGTSTQTNVGIAVEDQVTPQILKLSNLREFTINGIKIRLRLRQTA